MPLLNTITVTNVRTRLYTYLLIFQEIFLFSATKYNSQQILDIVFILRVLRLIRIVDSIQR